MGFAGPHKACEASRIHESKQDLFTVFSRQTGRREYAAPAGYPRAD